MVANALSNIIATILQRINDVECQEIALYYAGKRQFYRRLADSVFFNLQNHNPRVEGSSPSSATII